MGIFSRKDKIMDLTEDYKYEKKHPKEDLKTPSPTGTPVESQESSSGGFFNFFGSSNTQSSSSLPSSSSSSEVASSTDSDGSENLDAYEKRRRLAKRLKDMTDRIEEQSNQIYLLQQRIDLLEKKIKVGKYSAE
jgi:hypothetical protein